MNVYDFDKTIFSGDSTFAFYRWCLARYRGIIRELPGTAAAWCRYYILHRGNKTEFKQRMYRFLTHVPDAAAEAEKFWQEKKGKIKTWYLMQKASDDVIISASPEFLIEPIGKIIGVHTIASRVDPETGVYDGLNCHGEEKVKRFRELYPDAEVNEFYSDALSDSPMARISKKAFLVSGENLSPWPESSL